MSEARGERFRALAALALDAIDAPALVVARSGEILYANETARRQLGPCPQFSAADAGEWALTPLREGGEQLGFLAISRRVWPGEETGDTLDRAHEHWKLTRRQREVLELVSRGLTNGLIAECLGIRKHTVEFHVAAVFDKAGVANRATLIARLHDL